MYGIGAIFFAAKWPYRPKFENSRIHSMGSKNADIPEWIDPFYFIFNLVLYAFYSLYCSKFPSADKINL